MNYILYKATLERNRSTWNDCVEVVEMFQTFADFKYVFHQNRPSVLSVDQDYQFFKEGFLPDWYDPANKHGGRYILQNLQQITDEAFNQLWLDVVEFVMSSESLPGGSGVVGALVKVRGLNGYKRTISIWMSSESTMITRSLIGRKLKEKLKLDHVYFALHVDLERGSIERKARRHEELAAQTPEPVETVRDPAPLSWRSRPNKSAEVEVKSWRRK